MKKIYVPQPKRAMSVIVFASGGGGNLNAAIEESKQTPHMLSVDLVITDRLGIPAIDIAQRHGSMVIDMDFEKMCGRWSERRKNSYSARLYKSKAEQFHNMVYTHIRNIERKRGRKFDLAVLSYHRWIHGKLLRYFQNRMINQHAGDLTVINNGQRAYCGINPVLMSLKAGETRTRTSTLLVDEGHDTGAILCQGPLVHYTGTYPITKERAGRHEIKQKRQSDWPSLRFALRGIAQGHFSVSSKKHFDSTRIIFYQGHPLPYGGISL